MESDQRIIIATFASNVSRLQQILDIAGQGRTQGSRRGRSMEKISKVSVELGYLKDSGKVMIDISEIKRYARSQLIIVSTGSQGETMSALYRMAYGSHKQVEVNSGDRILIAASAIPATRSRSTTWSTSCTSRALRSFTTVRSHPCFRPCLPGGS